jgi:hypothetical protein
MESQNNRDEGRIPQEGVSERSRLDSFESVDRADDGAKCGRRISQEKRVAGWTFHG